MTKMYHLTKLRYLPSILIHGLKPKIGNASKIVGEWCPAIYLTNMESIPYWRIITGSNILLEVEVDEKKLKEFDYSYMFECMTAIPIPSRNIKIKKFNVPIQKSEMDFLIEENLWSLSSYCEFIIHMYESLIEGSYYRNHVDDLSADLEYIKRHATIIIANGENLDFNNYELYKFERWSRKFTGITATAQYRNTDHTLFEEIRNTSPAKRKLHYITSIYEYELVEGSILEVYHRYKPILDRFSGIDKNQYC